MSRDEESWIREEHVCVSRSVTDYRNCSCLAGPPLECLLRCRPEGVNNTEVSFRTRGKNGNTKNDGHLSADTVDTHGGRICFDVNTAQATETAAGKG